MNVHKVFTEETHLEQRQRFHEPPNNLHGLIISCESNEPDDDTGLMHLTLKDHEVTCKNCLKNMRKN